MKRTPAIRRSPWAFGLAALLVGLGACGVEKHPFESTPAMMGSGGSTGGTGVAAPSAGKGGAVGGGGATGGTSGPSMGGNSGGTVGGSGGTGGAGGRIVDGGSGAGGRVDGGAQVADAAPPSGITVNIGGKAVPKEKAIVFIHVGHSDMMGRATKPPELDTYFHTTHPQLWMYKTGGMFVPAKESTGGNPSTVETGPGMAILRTALTYAPADAQIVSIGKGASGNANAWCLTFRKSADLFYKSFMAPAMELKGKVTFGGIFTIFGVTEYHTGPAEWAKFSDCLVGLADDIRTDLGEPNIPLVVGGWNVLATGIYAPTSEAGKICIPQIALVPSKTKFATVIPTEGFTMQDDHHLDRAGHKAWAERGFMLMKTNGLLPWAQ